MLIRKTLIEKQLGFYDFHLGSGSDGIPIDLSFPWKVDRQFLAEFSGDIGKWRAAQEKRPKLISTILFRIYSATLGIYFFLSVVVIELLYSGYFR